MSDTVQQIKDRLSIVDVVQPYVKLTRAGKYWKGLSPFSKEKTASFFVTPDRGLYHCFSSGKGGDMFTFIQELEGVDFKGALKILAEKAGVELVPEAPGVRDEREQVLAALADATLFFESTLKEHRSAVEYLERRGVDAALVKQWSVGYAPKEWQALKDFLVKKGYSDRVIELAGLVKKADSSEGLALKDVRLYDRFRGRIMFPIRDASARVIGFSGRIFEDDAQHPQAKYINSPEGPVFDKSRALYGIHTAKSGIRDLGFAMLVEGQVDLLMVHKLGYRNAVATSGTAFTPAHAEILARYSPNLLISYDGDKAGVAAAGRAAAVALPRGMNVKIVSLPGGVDPAELVHSNPAAYKEAVKNAVPVVDFFLSYLKGTIADQRTFGLEVGRTVLPFVAMIENSLDQAYFVGRVAEALRTTPEIVTTELKKITQQSSAGATAALGEVFGFNRERFLLGLMLTFEEEKNTDFAVRAQKLLVREVGEESVSRLRELPLDELNRAQVLASEQFFIHYAEPAAQEAALAQIEREERARFYESEKERLKLEVKNTKDADEQLRLLEKLDRLAKEYEN